MAASPSSYASLTLMILTPLPSHLSQGITTARVVLGSRFGREDLEARVLTLHGQVSNAREREDEKRRDIYHNVHQLGCVWFEE